MTAENGTSDEVDRAVLEARVRVPWWLWREAEASVALSRDDEGTFSLDEGEDRGGAHTSKPDPTAGS